MKSIKLCMIFCLLMLILTSCKTSEKESGSNSASELKNTPSITAIETPEVGLYTQLLSGLFYTNSYVLEDENYVQLRKEAIAIYKSHIHNLANLNTELYSKTEQYKNNILEQLDLISDPNTLAIRKEMFDSIILYNIAIETWLDEIDAYNSVNTEMSKSIAENLVFDKTIDVFNLLDRYMDWLVKSNDVLSYMLSDTNFYEINREYYGSDLAPIYLKGFNELLAISDIFSYISSADYYKSKELIAAFDLSNLKETDEVLAIKNIQSLILEGSNPDYLIVPPNQNTSNLGMVSLLAFDNGQVSLADNILLMSGFLAYKQERDGYVSQEVIDELMMFVILNTDTNKNGQNDLMDYLKDNNYDYKKQKSTQPTHSKLLQKVVEKDPLIQPKVTSLFITKVKQDDLNTFASKLSTAQMGLLAMSYLEDSNALYSTITTTLSDLLLKNKGALDPGAYLAVEEMINHDLEVILGDKKQAFVNKIINSNVDEIVEKFSKWQDKSSNSGELIIDKNTIFSLLEVLDIKIEAVKEDTQLVNENTNKEDPSSKYANLNITRTDLAPEAFFSFRSTDDEADIIMTLYGVDLKEAIQTIDSKKSEIKRYTFTMEPYRAVIVEMDPDDSSFINGITMITYYEDEKVKELAHLYFYYNEKPIMYQRMRVTDETIVNEKTVLKLLTGEYYPVGMQFTYGYPTGTDVTEYISEITDYGDGYIYFVKYQFDGSLQEEILYEYTGPNSGTYNQKKYYIGAFDNQIHFDINGIFSHEKNGFAHNYNSIMHGTYTEYDRVNGKTNVRQFVNGQPQ